MWVGDSAMNVYITCVNYSILIKNVSVKILNVPSCSFIKKKKKNKTEHNSDSHRNRLALWCFNLKTATNPSALFLTASP